MQSVLRSTHLFGYLIVGVDDLQGLIDAHTAALHPPCLRLISYFAHIVLCFQRNVTNGDLTVRDDLAILELSDKQDVSAFKPSTPRIWLHLLIIDVHRCQHLPCLLKRLEVLKHSR